MNIDCPFFDVIKSYPYHYMLMVKYDALLREHGFGIWVRDTDRTDNCVIWGISSDGVEANDDVKKLSMDFAREFYSTCEKCGNRISNSPHLTLIGNDESCFGGEFDDEGFMCDDCKANMVLKRMIGYGNDIFCWLDCIRRCKKSDDVVDKILLDKIQRHKMMFTNDDGRVGYCRFGDIREYDGQWYLIAPKKNKKSIIFWKKYPFEVPSGYEAVHINPEGYDLCLRDIYDERVYSNSRAVVLYKGRICPADPYTTPYGHSEEMMKSGRIIVTGHWFSSGYKKILNNMYSIEYDELVSIIGKEQAEKYSKQICG